MKPLQKGDSIRGYELLQDFSTTGAGLCRWTFVRKDKKDFFLKEFLSPTYPTDSAPGSEAIKQKKRVACEQFEANQKAIIEAIRSKVSLGGNLIHTLDFFRFESKFYKVTEKITALSLSPQEISTLPIRAKILILTTVAHSLNILHQLHIIHSDLKPDNILISQTKFGVYSAKLIDLDSSYFEKKPPQPDELVGDFVYYSPELAQYVQGVGDAQNLTVYSDIFSLGLIFCQYLTGQLPEWNQEKYSYPWEAVMSGDTLQFPASDVPIPIQEIIIQTWHLNPEKRPSAESLFLQLREPEKLPIQSIAKSDEGKTPIKSTLKIKGLVKEKRIKKESEESKSGSTTSSSEKPTTKPTTGLKGKLIDKK